MFLSVVVPMCPFSGQVLYYMYAILGMELFSGKVLFLGGHPLYQNVLRHPAYPNNSFCGNPALNGTMFWDQRYCGNNFNHILRAFVVLFELTVVNQWHGKLSYSYLLMNSISCTPTLLVQESCILDNWWWKLCLLLFIFTVSVSGLERYFSFAKIWEIWIHILCLKCFLGRVLLAKCLL